MPFFRDRFLIIVVTLTAIIILAMAIIRLRLGRETEPTSRLGGTPSALAPSEQRSTSEELQPLPPKGPFRVTRVLDGDTIVLDNGETVRLIGVDAPETHHPEIPVQRFGKEATEFLRRLVEGFECTLEYEPNKVRDQYGRLLAYVFVGDRLANAEIIRRGYAYAYTRFPSRRQAEFIMLEREAREKQYGLWHLSLRDGRIANLVKRYESLSMEGRKKLDEIL
ncbi:MAG TPA: thermonuclease family protein, partial [Thermoleophilia bacterium]|nr:thermonuclease family protein [Thermoleophilia bacterium]